MTPNTYISQAEAELEAHFASEFIAHIDGSQAPTLGHFYKVMADILEIPNFEATLESLNDALNDLQWLEDKRVILYFTNTNDLIRKEKDPAKLGTLLNLLDATAEDWKWVDEDEEVDKKELIMVFEDSVRIRTLLEKQQIDYAQLTELN